MLKKPLTNEQMKKLVGHYLTNDYDTFKYLVTGYCEDMNGMVSILVADRWGETRYSASDLVDSNFRIDSPDGKGLWNDSTEDVLRIVESLVTDVLQMSLSYTSYTTGIHSAPLLQRKLNRTCEEAKHKIKSILSEESGTK